MTPRGADRRNAGRRGSALVEFAIVAMLLFTVILACFEFDRMLLTYTSLANAASTGTRYAIVHGSVSPSASGPGNDPAPVVTAVKNMAVLGMLDLSRLDVRVRYPDGHNDPGGQVTVTVVYPYTPWVPIPLRPTLAATSAGVIVY